MLRLPPRSTLFPSPTLFESAAAVFGGAVLFRPVQSPPYSAALCFSDRSARRGIRRRRVFGGRLPGDMLLSREEMTFDWNGARLDPVRDRAVLGWMMNQFLYGEV